MFVGCEIVVAVAVIRELSNDKATEDQLVV